jgi:hypothetical protein
LRTLLAIGAFLVLANPANAQRVWEPEIGFQAGFSSVKPAGTGGNSSTFIDLPGGGFFSAILTYAPLYAVVPVGNRLALEPQIGASQVTLGGTAVTLARIGLRLDYGFGRGFYGAAGGVLNYLDQGAPGGNKQVGLQVGLGYRTRLVGPVRGRLEASWVSTHASDLTQAFNAYSVLVGVSSSLGHGPASRGTAVAEKKAWSPALGIVGGYGSAHVVGTSGNITGIFFPGGTSSFGLFFGAGIPAPSALFAIIPLGGRWAIEPSLDVHHVSQSGSSVTALDAGARVDYAVSAGWYAAAGAQLTNVNPSTGPSGTITGASVAWGARFHLAGPTGGRVELNYLMSGKDKSTGTPPINTLSILLGLTMPLR